MKRKLMSVLLCALALLLLMGAGTVPEDGMADVAEEESVTLDESSLEAEAEESIDWSNEEVPETCDAQVSTGADSETVEPQTEEAEEPGKNEKLLVDGVPVSADVVVLQENGMTYVALSAMARELDSSVESTWDGVEHQVVIHSDKLELTAKLGNLYLIANGRYLYIEKGVRLVNDIAMVPLTTLAKAFDAKVEWNAETSTVMVTRGSGAIMPGDQYYDENDLFWLCRIITAESANQPLKGQIAVGNVVLNRVKSHLFPDTVKGVLSQKNQFSPYKNGALANRQPKSSCIIAAKLAMDGGEVEATAGALWFDGRATSWASRNKVYAATIGGHSFYRQAS